MKKWLSLLLSLVCLFSFSAVATAEDADFLSQIQGTFVELFPVLSEEQYHDAWLNNVTPLVGEEAAEDTVSYLLYMCTATCMVRKPSTLTKLIPTVCGLTATIWAAWRR